MSLSSLAISRPNASKEINSLANAHLQNDLLPSDREALKSAAQKFSTFTTFGSLLGLGLGVAMAARVRRVRANTFAAFRAMERPTHVMFAGGRTEALPDLTPLLKPSTAGDVAAYVFFSLGGLFIGGETGLLLGSYSAKRSVMSDPESRARIETAFRRFKVDVLRQELAILDGSVASSDMSGVAGSVGTVTGEVGERPTGKMGDMWSS